MLVTDAAVLDRRPAGFSAHPAGFSDEPAGFSEEPASDDAAADAAADPAGPTSGTVSLPARRSADRAALPVAVAQPVAGLVTGWPRPAAVLAVHSAAVILRCDVDGTARVVTVSTAQASGVPNGARTTLHAGDRPFAGIAPGDTGRVGAGEIRLPGLRLRAVRIVRTTVPRVRPLATAVTQVAGAARAALRGVSDEPVLALWQAVSGRGGCGLDVAVMAPSGPAACHSEQLDVAVTALVGLGSGSTPGGDDVLCGVLAGLHAIGASTLAGLIAAPALRDVSSRTALMSADLLRLAAGGHACAEAAAVLRACDRGAWRPGAVRRALDRLLAIGHTSGADLATGLAIGLAIGLPVSAPTGPRGPRVARTEPPSTARAGSLPRG